MERILCKGFVVFLLCLLMPIGAVASDNFTAEKQEKTILANGAETGKYRLMAMNKDEDSEKNKKDEGKKGSAGNTVKLEDILVSGRPIENYAATDALTGTKSAAKLLDLPISIAVVPQQLIEDRVVIQLIEALDNVSSAQRKPGYGGTQNFGAYIRGFDSSFLTLRNGFRDYGFYTLRDTANVERFEVLKGPSSVLYGAAYPGGITQTITKKPVTEPLFVADLMVDSFGFFRTTWDMGNNLGDDLAFRTNIAIETGDSFRDHVTTDGKFFAPVIRWTPTDRTRWTLELEYKQSDYTWDLGLPRDKRVLDLPTNRFFGEPGTENDVTSMFISSVFEYRLGPQWLLKQNLSYAMTDGDYQLRSGYKYSADGTQMIRTGYDTNETSEAIVLQHELVGDLKNFLGTDHQLVFGVEFYHAEQAYDFLYGTLASLDVNNPVYGAQLENTFWLFADEIAIEASAVYFQDLVAIGERFKVLAGGRYDQVNVDTYDRLDQERVRDANDQAFSYQFGIVYQPTQQTSLYASYGTSFLPITTGRKADGSFLDPETGRQYEVGIKHSMFDGKANATLSAFKITKENVRTPDPVNTNFSVQVGEQESQGVEMEVVGSVAPGLDLIVSAAYVDAKVTRDNTYDEGSLLPGIPEWSGSLWGKYTIPGVEGLSFGLGVYGATERQPSIDNVDWTLPGYFRFDAMAAYQFGKWGVQLNVKNIADEDIYDLSSTAIMPQQPRTVILSVKRQQW